VKVSVVIPAFNQAAYLDEAIRSALAQTHRDLEVIVVDDGSTDTTREVCEALRAADPRVVYVRQDNDRTRGIGARNAAMLRATGEWVALLDQDDLWAPDKLERQLALAAADPRIGMVFCPVRTIDENGRETGRQAGELPRGDVFHALLERNRYHAAAGIFQRRLLSVAGLPHESCGFADWALWLGLARHTQAGVVDAHVADYRVHGASYIQQMEGGSLLRGIHEHLATLAYNALRAHPGCAQCRAALSAARIDAAKRGFSAARRLMRQGRFAGTGRLVALGARTAPGWTLRPWVALSHVLTLAAAAVAGLVRAAVGGGRRR